MSENKNIKFDLSKTKKENPFQVPDGYFDSFSVRLAEKLSAQKKRKYEKKFLFVTRPQLIYISSFILVVLITYGIFKYIPVDSEEPVLTQQEIAEVIENEIFDYEENLLIENYDETELSEEVVIKSIIEEPVTEVNSDNDYSEEIINYLVEEDIDLESIVQEL